MFTCTEKQRLPTRECIIAMGKQALGLSKLAGERPEIMGVGFDGDDVDGDDVGV